jgi:GNAT superfamily N-acetyltransferase
MRYCYDSNSLNSNARWIPEFKKLYESGFPDVNEREDFQAITDRVAAEKPEGQPHSILLFDTSDEEKPAVTGGLIADWYATSRCIHLIYLIVDPGSRKKGLGRKLITDGVAWMKEWIKNERATEIRNVFFESNIPWKTKKENDNFDAVTRLTIFSNLGARLIDIPYVQPALDPAKKSVDNLFLLSFTRFNALGDTIAPGEILAFLYDLYSGLGIADPHNNEDFKKMKAALEKPGPADNPVQLLPIPTQLESPSFGFNKVSVTFHFMEETIPGGAAADKKEKESSYYCRHFSSFERDLFNFQNQKNLPMSSKLVRPNQNAVLLLPKVYSYVSEGDQHVLYSRRVTLPVVVSISFSQIFLSGEKIWHLTVAPAENEVFTEYDLIKLVSLFGSTQEESTAKEQIRFKQKPEDTESFSVAGLIIRLCEIQPGKNLKSSGTGIVQIDSTGFSPDPEPFFRLFLKNKRADITDGKIKLLAKAVCGIILGIFDFERMDEEEIYDTIQPMMPGESSLMVLCRGTLFKMTADDEIMNTVKDSILVSPYLLVPATVLAHNEHLLTVAKEKISYCLDGNKRISQKQLVKNQTEINSLINFQYLDGLFQYPTENLIVKTGDSQRGLSLLKTNIETRLKELSAKIETKRSNFSLITDSVIALVLFLIAITEFYKYLAELLDFKQNLSSILLIALLVVLVYVVIVVKKKN